MIHPDTVRPPAWRLRAMAEAGTLPAGWTAPGMLPEPTSQSADLKLINGAVAAAVAEFRANAVKEVAENSARAAAAEEGARAAEEAETDRLAAEIAGFAPGAAPPPLPKTAPAHETDEAGRLAAAIAAFVPGRDRTDAKPETEEDLAEKIAAFAPGRSRKPGAE